MEASKSYFIYTCTVPAALRHLTDGLPSSCFINVQILQEKKKDAALQREQILPMIVLHERNCDTHKAVCSKTLRNAKWCIHIYI